MKNLLLAFVIILFFRCGGNNHQAETSYDGDYVFMNVNILTMKDNQVLTDYAVIIENGKIKGIEPTAVIDTSLYKNVIDGSGKYLLPGLTEMHAHIPHPNGENDRINETLFLYLSNGITTIRGMLGHPFHLELRTKVDSGDILGPRIFTSGPSLNGNTVKTVDEATQMVKEQKSAGYNFLKLHPGLKPEVFDEIVRTAKDEGIDFAGHVSVDVGIVHALESGYASIDHVDGYLEGLVPPDANVNPEENGFFGYNFAHLADPGRLPDLIKLTKDNNVWVVTTQSLFTRWASPTPAEEFLSQPEMKYMPASTLQAWQESKNNLISNPDYTSEQWKKMMEVRKQIIKLLDDETDLLLLGSDAPQVFNVPGFSIHHEINSLLECGLTPFEVLRMGTVKPALFFGKKGEFGTVEIGASADLILINGNPLSDINFLKDPEGVMVRGRWLDREFLNKELERIATESTNM